MPNPSLSNFEQFCLQAELIQQFTPDSPPSEVAEMFAEFRRLMEELTRQTSHTKPLMKENWPLLTKQATALTLIKTYAKPDLTAFLQGDTFALADLQEKVAQIVKLFS